MGFFAASGAISDALGILDFLTEALARSPELAGAMNNFSDTMRGYQPIIATVKSQTMSEARYARGVDTVTEKSGLEADQAQQWMHVGNFLEISYQDLGEGLKQLEALKEEVRAGDLAEAIKAYQDNPEQQKEWMQTHDLQSISSLLTLDAGILEKLLADGMGQIRDKDTRDKAKEAAYSVYSMDSTMGKLTRETVGDLGPLIDDVNKDMQDSLIGVMESLNKKMPEITGAMSEGYHQYQSNNPVNVGAEIQTLLDKFDSNTVAAATHGGLAEAGQAFQEAVKSFAEAIDKLKEKGLERMYPEQYAEWKYRHIDDASAPIYSGYLRGAAADRERAIKGPMPGSGYEEEFIQQEKIIPTSSLEGNLLSAKSIFGDIITNIPPGYSGNSKELGQQVGFAVSDAVNMRMMQWSGAFTITG